MQRPVLTVVFENGLGTGAWSWAPVQEQLAGRLPTFAYDRTAIGLDDAVAELRAQLPAPPYLLVGHSLGAFNVRRFAGLYPAEVAGLVLVDPSHERQYGPLLRVVVAVLTLLQRRAPGWFSRRYARQPVPPEYAGLDPEVLRAAVTPEAVRRMGETLPRVYREAQRLGKLGDLPLIVLGAGQPIGGARLQARRKAQLEELAALSSRGELRRVEGSGHMIPLEKPEAVAEAILDLSR